MARVGAGGLDTGLRRILAVAAREPVRAFDREKGVSGSGEEYQNGTAYWIPYCFIFR